MDFTFTDEQRMMAQTFREFAAKSCPPSRLRAIAEGGGSQAGLPGGGLRDRASCASDTCWPQLVELGFPGMLAPPSHGGLGLGSIDFVLIAEEAGRAALPEPLVEHAGIAVPALAELLSHPRASGLFEAVATGQTRVAIGHPTNPFVLDAARANSLLLVSSDEIHLVERSRARLTHQPSIDPLRALYKVEALLDESTLVAHGQFAQRVGQRVLAWGALYCAAQLLGLCERMIDLAVAYARERKQFDRPIGSYQAIQHQLATARVKLEFARPVVYAAATRAGSLDERAEAAVSHAKLAAADAADVAARTALQVHGAMGYSWEVDLHFYMKRAWALMGAWGDAAFHLRRLSTLLLEDKLALGPGHTFDLTGR